MSESVQGICRRAVSVTTGFQRGLLHALGKGLFCLAGLAHVQPASAQQQADTEQHRRAPVAQLPGMPIGSAIAPAITLGEAMDRGLSAYRQGRYADAVAAWSVALANAGDDAGARSQALARRALAYQALGRHPDALDDLRNAVKLAEDTCSADADAGILDALGSAYFFVGRPDTARRCLARALASAEAAKDLPMRAVILNNQGMQLEAQEQLEDAAGAFSAAMELAERLRLRTVHAKALVNLLAITARAPALGSFESLWPRALSSARALPESASRSLVLAHLGSTGALAERSKPGAAPQVRQACDEAERIARRLGDSRLTVNAQLCQADLQAAEGQAQAALTLLRRTLLVAGDPQLADLSFAVLSRMAALQRGLGRNEDAIATLRQAVATLESIRGDLALARHTRSGGFRATVEPVYSGLADLLLRRAQSNAANAQPILREARAVIELFKAAELRDYFQDDCVDSLQARRGAVEIADGHAAVLYPIVMPDRVVLLISFPDGTIMQRPVSVDRASLARSARELREAIHQPGVADHLTPARKLYDALLRDLEPELATRRIDTLAVVPDGPMRWIPFAALHDGQGYVVSRYAIATIPGLDLIDARSFRSSDASPLLAGLSLAVGEYSALKAVPVEIEGIRKIFGGRVLRDAGFTSAALQRELSSRPYSVVHLATHGEFSGDAARSFLLTADGELSMDRLQRLMRLSQYRDTPIELLTLSACETAAGDDRAALGLAGLAMQAGARSALATLWRVHDDTTAALITDFYTGLARPGTSKAQALRLAQMRVIEHPQARFRHPYYWSPFLLIGNWL